jgi:hypothetical protein
MQGKQPSSQAFCKKFFTKLEGDENKYALVVHATNSDRWRCKCGCAKKQPVVGGAIWYPTLPQLILML